MSFKNLEKENVHFLYTWSCIHNDDMLRNYFQISDKAISEAETKRIIQDEYCIMQYIYRIGYVLIIERTTKFENWIDLVALRLIKKKY